jgi:tRNA (adenine57-N1/adenine58-N1)-methyltransferase
MRPFRDGDTVMILLGRKRFLVRLRQDEVQHTHKGLIPHADIIGQPSGTRLATHLGHPYVALLPSLHDIIMSIQRISQIVYPKEIGYILLKLNVGAGSRVIECGTGSGAMTIALAHAVRPEGRVYTYERRADMMRVAAKNLVNAGLEDWVDLKERDLDEAGFDELDVDALFLDVRTPWDYLGQVWDALGQGGFFGAIVPTTNQVSELLSALEERAFHDVEVAEVLLRQFKPVAARLRPVDRMVAHTGYLVFARRPASERAEADSAAPAEHGAECTSDGGRPA